MDRSKLIQASTLIDQANNELQTSLEHSGLDEYDYENSIRFASKLILKAQERISTLYDETKGAQD